VCAISLVPLFLLALIDQYRLSEINVNSLFWSAIGAGQLYLYSFALFGTLFWLCQKEHENFARFKPRLYLMFIALVPCILIIGIYLLDPSMTKPLAPSLVRTSFWIYGLYIVLYYILLVFDNFQPRGIEEGLQENARTLITRYLQLGDKP
jgi:Na+-transporting NADH:ubiquinone oxidoreductase subunit NqrB